MFGKYIDNYYNKESDPSALSDFSFYYLNAVFSLSGSNRENLLPQATASNSSYRLQPLDGLLKLFNLFEKKYLSGIVPYLLS